MKLLAYKGKGFISRLIRFQTRSSYSHVAALLNDGTIVESWMKGGVSHVKSIGENHAPSTEVDVFKIIDSALDHDDAEIWLKRQVGKKYDFKGVFRFLSRRKHEANDKWFCNELFEQAVITGGGRLLRGSPSHHAPAHTVMSPCLQYLETRIC